MSSSRWCRFSVFGLLTAAGLFFQQSQGLASINQVGSLLVPVAASPKSCSGAFRYAARLGNTDIMTVSPVHILAEDRRLSRTRYTSRAMVGLGAERSVLMSSNAMC